MSCTRRIIRSALRAALKPSGRAVAPDGAAFYGTAEAVPLTKQGYSAGCERGPFRFGVGVERWRETHLSAQMRARRWGTRRDESRAAQRGY